MLERDQNQKTDEIKLPQRSPEQRLRDYISAAEIGVRTRDSVIFNAALEEIGDAHSWGGDPELATNFLYDLLVGGHLHPDLTRRNDTRDQLYMSVYAELATLELRSASQQKLLPAAEHVINNISERSTAAQIISDLAYQYSPDNDSEFGRLVRLAESNTKTMEDHKRDPDIEKEVISAARTVLQRSPSQEFSDILLSKLYSSQNQEELMGTIAYLGYRAEGLMPGITERLEQSQSGAEFNKYVRALGHIGPQAAPGLDVAIETFERLRETTDKRGLDPEQLVLAAGRIAGRGTAEALRLRYASR